MSSAPASRPPASRAFVAIALGLPALLFAWPLGRSGIWDPPELGVADLARRIAVHVYGASSLELAGADNTMPKLGDLGRNELPFDAVALGFRLFGLHEWAGRLPLAIFGLIGVAALYLMLSRLLDRRAGVYGALVLATMPLYFVHARTMLGDIVTMASLSVAFAGLSLATFGVADEGQDASRARAAAFVLGLAGLATGFFSRGLVVGVALPAISVGFSWAIARAAAQGSAARDPVGDAAGAASFVVGALAALVGTRALFAAVPGQFSVLVGTSVAVQAKFPTFDFVLHWLGHSLFPWSAFLPLAVGRLFRPPPRSTAAAERREQSLRLTLLVGSAIAFGAYAMLSARVGHIPFGAPAVLAAIAAVAVRDFERGAPASRAVAVACAIFAVLMMRDYLLFPEKGLSAFAVANATLPDSFKETASRVVLLSTLVFVAIVFLAWMESDDEADSAFDRKAYAAWPRTIARAWDGNLLFASVVVEAALAGLALLVWLGVRVFHWKAIAMIGVPMRNAAMNAFWVLPVAVVVGVWAMMAARDAFRAAMRALGLTRGLATVAAGVLVGLLFGFWYYPALAAQLSPKDVFDSYARLHHGSEPLALLGVGGRSASYYAGGDTKTLPDSQSAFSWLTQGGGRRWLAVRNEDLARLNSLFRTRPGKKQNLPVLDARSSQILLVSSELAAGEANQSPFDAFLLDEAPRPAHPLDVNLQDQLVVLGWDVWDLAGKPVEFVVPARKFRFRTYYKVVAPPTGEWESFIHIDGFHRRFNGDHKVLGGKYALSLWQVGDIVVDDYEFALEPNFTPGAYNVFLGLFVGDTRMKVKTGKADDNRIDAGLLRVQ